MLMPKRVKRRRVFRGRMKGKAQRGNFLAYGDFGIVATEPSWVTARQIEAARIALTRYTKRGGQVWIKIFPDKPITEKPAETRMGSGKGSPEYWVAVVKPGRVLFEIKGVAEADAREALRREMIVFAQTAVVFRCAHGEHLRRLQPPQDGVERRFRQGHIGPQILQDLIAVGVLLPDRGQHADVEHAAFELSVHSIPPVAIYYITRSIICQAVFFRAGTVVFLVK